MIFASVLLKTYGALLVGIQPALAAACWAGSLVADLLWARRHANTGAGRLRDVLAIQACAALSGFAAHALWIEAATRWKDGLPLFAAPAAWLLNAAGFSAADFDGILHAAPMAGILQFPLSFDSLGFLAPLLFAAFGLTALLAAAAGWRDVLRGVAWLAAALFIATLLRWVFATLLFLGLTDFVSYESEELPILPFFKPGLTAALYLPFLAAAAVFLQQRLGDAPPPADDAERRFLPPRPGLSGLLALLLLALFWEPTGAPKQGEVLLNTLHAQWSRTDRPYDRDWYGAASGYNYACLKRLFERFYPTRELTTRITPEALADASVLVLFDPNLAFTEDEIRAVHAFVERGGGVFLIGDHTNVFGSTSHLNTIARALGLVFRDDVLFDLDEDFFQLYDTPRLGSLFVHGIDFFKFRGPASILPLSLFARTGFRVGHAKSLRAIYSVNNFYPPPHDDPKMRTGWFAASASARYGRGRVLAFADSTIFSNFEIFYPGKYEYLLNSLRWLNHADAPLTAPIQRLALLAALVLFAAQLARAGSPRRALGVLAAAITATTLAWIVARAAEMRRAQFPAPTQSLDALFFAVEPDDDPYTLRTFVTEAPFDQKYDVFFQWPLRADVFSAFYLHGPNHANELHRSWSESDQARAGMAMILRTPQHLAMLEALGPGPLAQADPLLLLVSTNLTREAAVTSLRTSGLLTDPADLSRVDSGWGNAELRIETGGRRVAVVMPAETFSDLEMGISEKVTPSDAQLARFHEQFALLDWLFRRDGAKVQEEEAADE